MLKDGSVRDRDIVFIQKGNLFHVCIPWKLVFIIQNVKRGEEFTLLTIRGSQFVELTTCTRVTQ